MAGKKVFEKQSQDNSTDALGVKNYVQIALSCTVSKKNAFLHFTQKFKMAAKNGRKINFRKIACSLCITLGVKKISAKSLYQTETPFLRSVLRFMQKLKMATKNAKKMIFGKNRQLTV